MEDHSLEYYKNLYSKLELKNRTTISQKIQIIEETLKLSNMFLEISDKTRFDLFEFSDELINIKDKGVLLICKALSEIEETINLNKKVKLEYIIYLLDFHQEESNKLDSVRPFKNSKIYKYNVGFKLKNQQKIYAVLQVLLEKVDLVELISLFSEKQDIDMPYVLKMFEICFSRIQKENILIQSVFFATLNQKYSLLSCKLILKNKREKP